MFKIVKNTRRNVRRSLSPTGKTVAAATSSESGDMNTAMSSFLHAESASAFLKPWLRLERGLRLQRFRAFAEEYPDIDVDARNGLYKALVKANDAKLLNTKQQIQYEEGKIVGIRGLKQIVGADGMTTFKIEAVRPTKRKSSQKEESDATEKN